MIYVRAFFLPPLALLLNGQIFAAVFNTMLFVLFLVVGPAVRCRRGCGLIAPGHAIISIYTRREDRKSSRRLVEAIGKHGAPPGRRTGDRSENGSPLHRGAGQAPAMFIGIQ